MRKAVMILGVLGTASEGILGFKWFNDSRGIAEMMKGLGALAKEAGGAAIANPMADLNKLVYASYVMIAAIAAGIVALVLFRMGKEKIAGGIMLTFGILPIVISRGPDAGIFTALMILAGILAMFAKPAAGRVAQAAAAA